MHKQCSVMQTKANQWQIHVPKRDSDLFTDLTCSSYKGTVFVIVWQAIMF